MADARPMLGDVELQLVQKLEADEEQVFTQHGVPALEGDFLQGLGRRATRLTLTGVLTGPEAGEGLKTLRDKFRAAEPVSFVSDITTATRVDQVLIEEMGVRELAGKPERFEYAFTLLEYRPATTPRTVDPPDPIIPPPPTPQIEENVGKLIVEVIVKDVQDYDYGQVRVTVQGKTQDGNNLSRTLTKREGNRWTEEEIPASQGEYTVTATTSVPEAMTGSKSVAVRAGQEATVQIVLRPGAIIATNLIVHFWFDNAFIEPCLRPVMREVADYAKAHPDEKLLIVGHTDKVGNPDYNQSLSERRARSAYAFLTFGRDEAGAFAEWDQLRRSRSGTRSVGDSWGAREYQYILQDLGYYPHQITEKHDDKTDAAVEKFQQDKGLQVDGIVGDNTWEALIKAYLSQDSLKVPENQFLPNASENCDSGILKWLGCGEEDPIDTRPDAWRPNRRTEFLFAKVDKLPCDVKEPDTFDLLPPNAEWCLDPKGNGGRCCFVTPAKEEKCAEDGSKWCRQPADPKKIKVKGSIKFEDGRPLANAEYVLLAADGEYLRKDGDQEVVGEVPGGDKRGRPIEPYLRTTDEGLFDHPEETPAGTYILELKGPYVARAKGQPLSEAKGPIVCKRLDGSEDFDVVVVGVDVISVKPEIAPDSTSVIVKKPHTNPARVKVTLRASKPFSGSGTFSRSNDKIKFFTAAAGGTEITFDGTDNVLTDAQLATGHTLFAEGAKVSDALEDVELMLALTVDGQVGLAHTVRMTAVVLTLDVDADRDGIVGQDEVGKDQWDFGASKKGAVILVNSDDDDLATDLDLDNTKVDGASDVADLAPIMIRQTGPLPPGVTVVLSVADKSKVRVFDQRSAAGTSIIGPASGSSESVIAGTTTGDVELGIEGTSYPDSGFDGVIDLKLSLKEGAKELASDNVKVRAAPWILPSHLNVTEELYIVEISGRNDSFVSEIEAIASGVGVPLVKANVNDRWMQDCMEIGYSHIPTKQFSVALNAVNSRPLDTFARDKLLGSDYGFHQPPLTTSSTFDSHGNIEVSPPVKVGGKAFKHGRIYYGGVARSATERFNVEVESFLKAQLVQKPFSIDTTWLGVGHVDEIVSFIPSNDGREFRMLFASVDEGLRILRDLQTAGHGGLTLFTGKDSAYLAALATSFGFTDPTALDHFRERTIDAILSDAALMAVNAGVQTRLNSVKAKFVTELGLDEAKDIILIPSLFTTEPLFPGPVGALIPGMVNLLVITQPTFADIRLVFPKPFGPDLGGVDQLEKDVQDKIIPLGYSSSQLKFVDDFDSYHVLSGEVHCGTNSKRQPHSTPWYEQEDF